MKLPGYSDWSTSVDVPANQVAQVSATLTKGSGTVSGTPGIGLSPFAVIGDYLAIGAIVLSSRDRKVTFRSRPRHFFLTSRTGHKNILCR